MQGNIKIEPSQGRFAYSVNEAAPFDITVFDLNNLGNPNPQVIPGLGFGGAISFHPTGKWAYYSPGNSGGQIGLLETGPSGTAASAFKTAATRGFLGRTGYGLMTSGDRAYMLSLGNGNYGEQLRYILISFTIQPDGTLVQASGPTRDIEGNDVNAAPQGAIIPVLPVRVDTEPALLGFQVGVDDLGNATDIYEVPNAPIGAHKVSVDPSVAPSNPNIEWTFQHWKVDGVSDLTMTNSTGQDVALLAPGRTFTALFEKRLRLTVNVTGLCTVAPLSGFYPEGASQQVNVTVSPGEVLNTIEFLPNLPSSSPAPLNNGDSLVLDGEGGTLTVSCTPVTPDPTHVVIALPQGEGLRVRADSSPLAPSPLPFTWVPGSTQNSVGTVSPQLNTAMDTAYGLVGWTSSNVASTGVGPSSSPDWLNITGPQTSTNFFANFVPAGYTVNLLGCPTTITPSAIVTSNPVVTYSNSVPLQLQANPPAGSLFEDFTITMGGATLVVPTNPATLTLMGPATVTAKCVVAPVCTPPPAGLSGWYSFEETAGSTSVSRISGAPLLNWLGNPTALPNAKVNRGISFQGAQYLEAANATAFNPGTSSFSFDFWLRASAPPTGNVTLVEKICGGVLGGPGCLPSSFHGWRVELTSTGRLSFSLGTTGTVGTASAFAPVTKPVLTDGNWHFIAVVVNRSAGAITLYVDGTAPSRTFTIPFNLPAAGSITAGLPLRVGTNALRSAYFTGSLDELEIFTGTAVSATDFQRIYDADSRGKCVPPATPVGITVNTNPAAINATVGAQTNFGVLGSQPDSFSASLPVGTTSLAVSASSPVTAPGGTTRYVLRTINAWSVNSVANPTYISSPQTVPVPTADTIYTANYNTQHEVKVVVNGTCAVTPQTGFYNANLQLPVTITPAAGATATWTFTGGSQNLVSGQSLPVVSPGTLTVQCSPNQLPLRIITSPANIGVVVGFQGLPAGNGTNTNSFSTTAAAGDTGSATATPAQQFDVPATTRWDLKGFTMNGLLNLGPVSPAGFTMPALSATIVAAYDTFYKVDVVNNGCATVNPVAGFYPAGSTLTVSVSASGTNQVGSILFSGPPAPGTAPSPIANNSTVLVDSPKILTATCGPAPTGVVIVNTNPPGIGVTVGLQNVGSQQNSYTSGPLVAGNVTLTATPVGPFVSPLGVRYQLEAWRLGSNILGPGPTQVAPVVIGATTTYTAFYQAIGNRVTVVNNGCATTAINPPLPADGILPSTSTINLSATPPAGGTFTSVSLAITDPATGSVQTVGPLTTVPFLNPIGLPGPTVITFTCAAPTTVGVTVNTSPANLGAAVGVGAATAPNTYTATLPAVSAQTLTAPAVVVTPAGIGYRLTGWTPAGPGVTLPATGAVTYTANYTLACYMITAQVQPAGTGTVTLSPAGLPDFPAGCYASGTQVTATLTPASGRIAGIWLAWAGGPGQTTGTPYTFSVIGAGQLIATTGSAAPNVNWSFDTRNGLAIGLRATNNGTAPATNLRITGVTADSGLRFDNQPPLPVTVGTLAPGASITVGLRFAYLAESLEPNPNAAFRATITSVADDLASFTATVPIPAPPPPPPTTISLEAVSRTNAVNIATLTFRVTNTGPNPTAGVFVSLSVSGPPGLALNGFLTQGVPVLAPGASTTLTFQAAVPSQQLVTPVTFTGTMQAVGNIPATSATWRFDSPTTIVPLP